MRVLLIMSLLIIAPGLISCSSTNPASPGQYSLNEPLERTPDESSRWLWGNWLMYIPEDHSSIEVIPVRNADKHYNVKILLEESPCDNCLWISKFKNNGDGTISVDITIRHPYPTNDYFTGFDVRGIVNTSTSYPIMPPDDPSYWYYIHIPAKETGDLEVLNPDGYTDSFSPFNDKSKPPILRYQPGGDLGGSYDEYDEPSPSYNQLWPFKNYYSSEVRRHFASSAVLTQTYHVALPPGEWEFGYSVDACWAPPTNVPVNDIEADFPPQANTLNHFRVDMEISGPLIGNNPSTITVRLYHHLPEVLELYTSDGIAIYSRCLDGNIIHADGPVLHSQYVEFTCDIVNELCRPPGDYPVLALCHLGDGDYLDGIEDKWFKNAGCHQVLWVTVE